MKLNFWNVFLIVVAVVIGIRLLGFVFKLVFHLTVNLLLPLVILVLAAYGVYKYLERR